MKSPGISIAGMHRSRTSMMAELLKRCGLELGDEANLVPPSYANEAGYWEDRRFVELNEKVLAAVGGAWDSVPQLHAAGAELWRRDKSLSSLTRQGKRLLSSLPTGRPSGWKDPRNTITLPFWFTVAPSLKVVVCLRNPLEVALSLQRIGAVRSNADGLKLWKTYNAQVMLDAPPDRRIITHTSQYFADPLPELRRVAQFAGLNVADRLVRSALKGIRTDLCHSQFCDCELREFGADDELIDLYDRMCAEASWSPLECRRVRARSVRELREVQRQSTDIKFGDGDTEPTQYANATNDSAQQGRATIAAMREEFHSIISAKEAEMQRAQEQHLMREDDLHASLYDLYELVADGSDAEALAYRREVRRIREIVRTEVPRNATIAVISRGDPQLLLLYGRKTCHYPQNDDGSYAEYPPTTSLSAIAHLEFVRARGADFLLVPATELWWLDQYSGFDRHLRQRYRLVNHDEDACLIFDLRDPELHADVSQWEVLNRALTASEGDAARDVAVLDWNTGLDLGAHFPGRHIFSPLSFGETLPYLDSSIDIVVVSEPILPARIEEARRVASIAMVDCQLDEGASPRVEWKTRPHASLPTFSLLIAAQWTGRRDPDCLPTIQSTVPRDIDGEILVIGNDEQSGSLLDWSRADSRVTAIRADPETSFAEVCNRVAAQATGEILILIHPETLLLHRWLQPLLHVFSAYPDAGVVGGKLLSAQGRLRHAGGIVFADGVVAGIGDGDFQVQAPIYSFVRAVDCCSVAMLATRRSVFGDVGGFSEVFPSGSYLAADYSWRVLDRAFRSYFQPESIGIFLDTSEETNGDTRRAFAKTWRSRLESQPARPNNIERSFWQALPLGGSELGRVET
jgi:GT2 family glycosyltransferase